MRIGVRREDKNQWEARTPLVPDDIRQLIDRYGIDFVVQPSAIRAFRETEFSQAGAVVQESLADCDVILAVKEIPVDLLLPGKTYIFFSHTIKGQKYNLPMLKRILDIGDTLIDYERIVDAQNRRLVFFGRYAGIAGMIDTFWAFGQRLVLEGQSFFSDFQPALKYQTFDHVREAYRPIARRIREIGLPTHLTPVIFGFSGYGHVSKGAQEVFDLMPHIEITADELPAFMEHRNFDPHRLVKVVFSEKDMVAPAANQPFELQDYYQHPVRYRSAFERYLPNLNVLVNAIYWDERYPRLVTRKYLKECWENGSRLPLKVIGDITCDVGGSIECNTHCTTPGNPVYVYEPLTGNTIPGVAGDGPVILAVDNLPCELPIESSMVFSHVLRNFIPSIQQADFTRSFAELNLTDELKRAMIVYHGKLTPDYQYLDTYLKQV